MDPVCERARYQPSKYRLGGGEDGVETGDGV